MQIIVMRILTIKFPNITYNVWQYQSLIIVRIMLEEDFNIEEFIQLIKSMLTKSE